MKRSFSKMMAKERFLWVRINENEENIPKIDFSAKLLF
jgi:hypothetical protein